MKRSIIVTFESNGALPTPSALMQFVAGAVDTVRSNYAAAERAGMFTGEAGERVRQINNSAITTTQHNEKWSSDCLTKMGGPLQEGITQLLKYKLEHAAVGDQAARDLANEILHLLMTSNLVQPGARELYESLPGNPV